MNRVRSALTTVLYCTILCGALGATPTQAAELKDLHVSPATVVGGQPIDVTVSLTSTGVAHPEIRSALPDIVPIPTQTIAIINRSHATVRFPTYVVSQTQPVVIVATLNGRTASKVVQVSPAPLYRGVRHEIDRRQMSYLLKHARDNGFRFSATRILRDTVACRVNGNAQRGLMLEVVRPRAPSIVDTVGACQFVLFANRTLAEGFRFVANEFEVRRSNGIGVSWRFVESPRSGADMRTIITAENKDPYVTAAVEIHKIVMTGPPGSRWEDAFQQGN